MINVKVRAYASLREYLPGMALGRGKTANRAKGGRCLGHEGREGCIMQVSHNA